MSDRITELSEYITRQDAIIAAALARGARVPVYLHENVELARKELGKLYKAKQS